MQKVEITDQPAFKVHCPFCGTAVITEDGLSQCEHVLFHASDAGFEYVDERLGLNPDIEIEDGDLYGYMDEIEYPNSFMIAIYQPAPSFFGGYVAFAAE